MAGPAVAGQTDEQHEKDDTDEYDNHNLHGLIQCVPIVMAAMDNSAQS